MTETDNQTFVELRARARDLCSTEVLDLVPRSTLIVVVVFLPADWRPFAAALAAMLMIDRRTYRSPWLWLGISALLGYENVSRWQGIDNHHFLVNYWCLALGLCFLAGEPERALRLTARLLVGFTFLLAAIWKFTSGEFLDGSFFHHALLVDPRFEPTATWVAGLSQEAYADNIRAVQALETYDSTLTTVTLTNAPRTNATVAIMTWWGSWFELFVGLVFLVGDRHPALRSVRVAVVVAFVVTTYLLVPVTTFGATLVLMTYAQTEARTQARGRQVLLVLLLFLVLWAPIWNHISTLPG